MGSNVYLDKINRGLLKYFTSNMGFDVSKMKRYHRNEYEEIEPLLVKTEGFCPSISDNVFNWSNDDYVLNWFLKNVQSKQHEPTEFTNDSIKSLIKDCLFDFENTSDENLKKSLSNTITVCEKLLETDFEKYIIRAYVVFW